MRIGTCKHYHCRPGAKHVCDKGIDIRAHVGGPDRGWMRRMPCVTGLSELPPIDPVPCDLYEDPAPEEVAEFEAMMLRMLNALADGTCGKCGAELERSGAAFWCPRDSDHASGFMCNPKATGQ